MEKSRQLLTFLSVSSALLLSCAGFLVQWSADSTAQPRIYKDQKENDRYGSWCIAKPSADEITLSINIDYSCAQSGVDCSPIQPGGSCFAPETTISHASYAMNLFYMAAGKHSWDCHFNASAITVTQDPSFGACIYPQ